MRLTWKIGTMAVGLGCLSSCVFIHEDMDCQHYTKDGLPFAYVGINVSDNLSKQVTKADVLLPSGGEIGDGNEDGIGEENRVNDISAFFFESTDGINGDASTPVIAYQYWSNLAFIYSGNAQYTTKPAEVVNLEVGHTYEVLVVTNVGQLSAEAFNTLGDVRDWMTSDVWQYERLHYTKFVMASADSGDKLFIPKENNDMNPATTGPINVERLSARVDYQANGSEGEEAGVYTVKSQATGEEIGKAKILGAMLINTLADKTKSYMFKRVTKASESFASGTIDFLGKEQADDGFVATNYVLDPKSRSGKSAEDFDEDTYYPNIGYDNLSWINHVITESLVDGLEDNYKCIGYPKENVNEMGRRTQTTGIVFQTRYTPNGYADGDTFFEWNNAIYPTLEKMMEAFDATSWSYYIKDDAVWKENLTWNELRTDIIAHLKLDDPAGYRAWLVNESNGKDGIMYEAKDSLRWGSYVKNVLKYGITDGGKAEVDIGTGVTEGTTRRLLHVASGVATYKDGICYYTYWIKHANDQNESNDLVRGKNEGGGPMEYAIVRNNIYKLRVRSISTPGGDIPGDRTVNVNILVENWKPETREEIIIKPKS